MAQTIYYEPRGAVRQLMAPLEALTGRGDAAEAIRLGNLYPEILIEGPAGTGKSRGVLEYIDQCCELFPGIRVLIARQTLSSLRESVLVSLEEKVWHPEHPCLTASDASRENRRSYTYPESATVVGGKEYSGCSHIVLAGLDRPEKTFSTEYDIVFVEEAIEASLDSWEKLLRVNRNWRMPWQVSIAATNPGPAFHWLNRRPELRDAETGDVVMKRLLSRHHENPAIWDREAADWTEQGRAYIEKKLRRMTSARRERLLHGRWVSEEGLIYESFDLATHAVEGWVGRRKDGQLVVREQESGADHVIKSVVGSMDFGFRNPASLSLYGCDSDGYWWHMVQVYQSERLETWWADTFAELYKQFKPSVVVADAASPGMIKALNVRIGRTDAHPIVRKADKDFAAGRDCVDDLLRADESGRPGLRFLKGNLRYGVDESLRDNGKPTCSLEEIQAYVWEPAVDGKQDKEAPKKENDHAMDELRYFARHVLTHDYRRRDKAPKFAPGTLGHVLGHKKKRQRRRSRA